MNFTIERFHIDDTNYFEVEACILNNERIVKPRSIKGDISGNFNIIDIKKDITDYLTY